jgi:hypothetical protein
MWLESLELFCWNPGGKPSAGGTRRKLIVLLGQAPVEGRSWTAMQLFSRDAVAGVLDLPFFCLLRQV